ncbi:hypothetical protein EEW87_015770 [Janibacter melonis]|uniref:DUF1579 domain-containing protein n=1 Tax=Janibacter melonis TaxID=262209 RepID=A0A5P8FR76_9MICO|nr:hypothetical protein [Janibacter melonis]QFQ31474.1 hypothetical protein EEW87_015770 [Janibacter melonis]
MADVVTLTGSCSFRLMPDDPLVEATSSATLTTLPDGAVVLGYRWTHPTDGDQHGSLLVGRAEEGAVEAAWYDTWHQHPGLMTLTGRREGAHLRLEATYGQEWGWQVELDLGEGSTAMTMRNVVPASAASETTPAGPYDVMVARWS